MPDALRETVSATEVAALFNASPYQTRWTLYHRFKGNQAEKATDNRMDWGLQLEPLVLRAAANDLRFEVSQNLGRTYERNGPLGCTRDATIICPDRGPGALETKCVFDYGTLMREWDGGSSVPRHHELQLQTQMFVGEKGVSYKWGVLAMWCGGEMKYYEREPLPELWAELGLEARKFLDDVANDREPEPFGSAIESPLLTKLYPVQVGKVLDLSEESTDDEREAALQIAEQVRMLQWHGQESSSHGKAEKAIKARLHALMKDYEELRLPHGIKVRLKQQARAGYTVEPTSFVTVNIFVPKDLPDGAL